MASHRTLRALGLALTLTLAATACSDDDGDGGGAAPDPASCNNSLELDGAAAEGGRDDHQFGAEAALVQEGRGDDADVLHLVISGFDLKAPVPTEPPADAPDDANLLLVTLEAPEGGFADGQTFTQGEPAADEGRIASISLTRGSEELAVDATTITLGRVEDARVCGSIGTEGSGVEGTFNAERVGGAPATPEDEDEGEGDTDGEGDAAAPDEECRTLLRVRGEGEAEASDPFHARAVVAEGGTPDDPVVRVAISSAELPDGVPAGEPDVAEGTNLLVFALVPAGDGEVASGQTFATEPGEGDGELADLAFWSGSDEVEMGAVTVTVSTIDDGQVCGAIETGGPGAVGRFRALRGAGGGGGDEGGPGTTSGATTTTAG